MIEKKIRYDINIEKPSKTKPVKQGGVLNYLGKQKTVNAPRHWRSSPKHPIAHLSYITKDEEKILIDLNLYGSLKGKPNKGPFGLPSLQGSGGGSEGAGTGDGGGAAGGPGGSEGHSTQSGPGPGESEGMGGPGASGPGGSEGFSTDTGPGIGEAMGMGMGMGMGPAGSEGFDSQTGPTSPANTLGQTDTFASDVDESAVAPATGIMNTLTGFLDKAIDTYMTYSPTVNAIKGLVGLAEAVANPRGVTAPDDYSQLETSVQFGPPPSATESSGGITNLVPTYAPLYNPTIGDNTVDSLIAIYRKQLGY